jgi:hypothetical protein
MRESGSVYRSTWNSPTVGIIRLVLWSLEVLWCEEGLTFSVVLGVRVRGLVVMYHLNDLQQVVLVQLLQTIGKLVHVDLCSMLRLENIVDERQETHILLSALLLLGTLLTSSTALGLKTVLITWNGARLTQQGQESRLGVAESLEYKTP